MASTVWRGHISFGLISIPVRLFRAARAERVKLQRLYRAPTAPTEPIEQAPEAVKKTSPATIVTAPMSGRSAAATSTAEQRLADEPILAPVQQVSIRSDSEQIIEPRSVVKGFEYERGRYVAIEPEELKAIEPKTATTMQIEEFVKLADVDPVYFETSYYVVPEEAGKKAYALLYTSLQGTGLVAVAEFAMHGREHVVIVRPATNGLIAHTMYFTSEVRADDEYHADPKLVVDKELQLAQRLIHALAGPFEPVKYRDTYREKLQALIDQRIAGQPAAEIEQPARATAVVDIAEALQRSLAALKKPVKSEEQPVRTGKSGGSQRKKKAG